MATILLIEDDNEIRQNVSELLGLAGYNVLTAANGKEGVDIAQKENPDLVVSDVMMPVIDGFGVLHILRKNPALKNTPFIFLTSKGEAGNYRQAMYLGANDYITKPFEGSELLSAVENRLNLAAEQREATVIVADDVMKQVAANMPTADDALQMLTDIGSLAEYKKKQVIYKEGSTPRFLYYIKSGKIKTYKSHDDGKDLVVGLYAADDYLGYAPLLENTQHIETAEMIEDGEVIMIPAKQFEELVNDNPQVAKKFMNLLARHLMEKGQQVIGLAYNTLRKKVAEALVTFYNKYHSESPERFTITIGRDELASIAGTATESLIRTLTEFKNEKLIEMHNGAIQIINLQKLKNLLRY